MSALHCSVSCRRLHSKENVKLRWPPHINRTNGDLYAKSIHRFLLFGSSTMNIRAKTKAPRERNFVCRHSLRTVRPSFVINFTTEKFREKKTIQMKKKSEEQPFNWIIKIDTRSPIATAVQLACQELNYNFPVCSFMNAFLPFN